MPLKPIALSELQKVGEGLTRPAGVAIGRDGRVWASDKTAAVAQVKPDGIRKIGKVGGLPNGLAMDRQGRILIANFGLETNEPGPLQRLDPGTGQIETAVRSADGRVLSASNHPVVTSNGAVYCTHSTWVKPLSALSSATAPDGLVYRIAPSGQVDVVAQRIPFPGGCCLDDKEAHLYIVQTLAGQVVRFQRRADGTLDAPKPYGPRLGTVPQEPLTPDAVAAMSAKERSRIGYGKGCQFDAEGNLWVTLPVANRVVAITPNLSISIVINDPEGQVVNMPSSLAFGGPDMRDLYIGMIGGSHIVKTRSPVPGLPLAHQR